MEKVRLGIIGTGIAARDLHWPALQKLQRKFEIVAVCNHTEPKAKAFAELVGAAEYHLDHRELLARTDIDAVSLILPIELNYSMTKAAVAAGKHVMVEKPIAANMKEAKAMIALEEGASVVTMVGENFRYAEKFLEARRILEAGKIGDLYAAHWEIFHYVDAKKNKYAQTKWRINHQFPGGFVMDGGVHNIHALRMLCGEFTRIYAQTNRINPALGEIDTLNMMFETDRSVQGTLKIYFSSQGYGSQRLALFGTKGTLVIDGNTIERHHAGKAPVTRQLDADGGYIGEYVDFHKAITTGSKPEASIANCYRDFVSMLAAFKSAETGKAQTQKF